MQNDPAMHAPEHARRLTEGRSRYVFAPALMASKDVDWIRSDSTTKDHFRQAMAALGIRQRPSTPTRICA